MRRSVGLLAWTGRQTAQKRSGLISLCRKFCLHLTSDRSKSVGSISSPVPRRALTWCRTANRCRRDRTATTRRGSGRSCGTAARGSARVSSTAGATVNAIEAPEAGAGQVPVIQLVDAVPITMQRGTNYAPLFELVCWVERDETVFGPRTVAPPGGAPIVVPASPSSHNLASVATPHAWSALTPSVQAPTNAWPVAA